MAVAVPVTRSASSAVTLPIARTTTLQPMPAAVVSQPVAVTPPAVVAQTAPTGTTETQDVSSAISSAFAGITGGLTNAQIDSSINSTLGGDGFTAAQLSAVQAGEAAAQNNTGAGFREQGGSAAPFVQSWENNINSALAALGITNPTPAAPAVTIPTPLSVTSSGGSGSSSGGEVIAQNPTETGSTASTSTTTTTPATTATTSTSPADSSTGLDPTTAALIAALSGGSGSDGTSAVSPAAPDYPAASVIPGTASTVTTTPATSPIVIVIVLVLAGVGYFWWRYHAGKAEGAGEADGKSAAGSHKNFLEKIF